MKRLEALRENAISPIISYDRFYLHFFQRYAENEHLQSGTARYADAYAYAFENTDVFIEENDLLAGLPPRPLNEEENTQYQQLLKTVVPIAFTPPFGQDSHMAVDYELLLREGISGVITCIEAHKSATNDAQKIAYYEACIACLNTVTAYSQRYAAHAAQLATACVDPQRKEELQTLSAICARVPLHPATSFHEAVQSVHFLSHCLSFDPTRRCPQQFQLGHPDRYLYPYYCADIQSSVITREYAQLLLDCLGIQINRRVIHGLSSGYMVGGRDAAGNIVQNELTEMGMQVIDDIRLVYPAVGLCYTKGMDDRFLQKACEILSHGRSHPAIFNDDIITQGLLDYGVPPEQACNYIHSTCVEITPVASSNVWVASPYTNMPQLLLDVMQEDCPTYEVLKEKLYQKLAASIEANFHEQNGWRKVVSHKNMNPLLSCFVNDCLKDGLDIYQGGAKYNWIMPSFVGVANLVDSLYVLKKVVFEEKRMTLQQMNHLLETSFENAEPMRLYLLNKIPKYGNNIDDVDALFSEITRFIDTQCRKYTPVFQNARLIPSVFCWIMHERFGSATGATPDGRPAHFPLGDGSGACQGREKGGPLASLISGTKWSHKEMIGGVAVNLKFSKKQFTQNSFQTMMALIKTYLQRGGFEIQINVTDRETLLDAVAHPENHRDLLVRIGGYSDYFIHLGPNMQQEVLLRTEHEV